MKSNKFMKTWLTCILLFFSIASIANTISCMKLTPVLNSWTPKIELVNQCASAIDMQGATLDFHSNQALGHSYWGSFASLAYPENTSIKQSQVHAGFNVFIPFKFPNGSQWWRPNSTLKVGEKISIQFSATPDLAISSLQFSTLGDVKEKFGSLQIVIPNNPTNNPAIMPVITINGDNGYSKQLNNLSFDTSTVLNDVPLGNYRLVIENINYLDVVYSANAEPSTIVIDDTSPKIVNINYTKKIAKGSLLLTINPEPESLINKMVGVNVTDKTTNSIISEKALIVGTNTTFSNLVAGNEYFVELSDFEDRDYAYKAIIQGANPFVVSANTTTLMDVNFTATPLEKSPGVIHVSGLPNAINTSIYLKDNKGYSLSQSVINGENQLSLPINRQYTIEATSIQHDNKIYQPFILPSNFITESKQSFSINLSYEEKEKTTSFSPYVDVTLGAVTRWDSQTQSMQPLGLLDMVRDAKLEALHLAFVTGSNQCHGTWAGYLVENKENAYGVPVFKALKDNNVKLTIALGGLAGQYLAQICDSESALVNAYQEIIDAYHPHALDFDIENSLQTDNIKLARMMSAIKTIKNNNADISVSFTLPVLPEGLVKGVGENVIIQAKNAGLHDYSVNIMAMDYGPYYAQKTMAEYAIDALKATFNQLKAIYPNQSDSKIWSRLEVTPMIGLNDTIPLNFTLQDVDVLKAFAVEKGLKTLSIWSLTRDKSCAYTYASPICSSQNPLTGSPNQTQDYEYSLRFLH